MKKTHAGVVVALIVCVLLIVGVILLTQRQSFIGGFASPQNQSTDVVASGDDKDGEGKSPLSGSAAWIENITKTESEPEFIVFGLVTDDQKLPVADASVMIYTEFQSRDTPTPIAEVSTDSRGRYEVNFEPVEEFAVLVAKEGYSISSILIDESQAESGSTEITKVFDASLTLQQPTEFQVNVFNEEDEPVLDATVRVYRNNKLKAMTLQAPGLEVLGETDENGQVVFNSLNANSAYSVTIEHPDYVTMNARLLKVTNVNLSKSGGTVLGTVTNFREGELVGKVALTLESTDQDQLRFIPDVFKTTADENGDYIFEKIPDGDYVIQASYVGARPYNGRGFSRRNFSFYPYDNEKEKKVDLTIDSGLNLTGVVMDNANQESLAGVRIELDEEATLFPGGNTAVSDENGQFEIPHVIMQNGVMTVEKRGYRLVNPSKSKRNETGYYASEYNNQAYIRMEKLYPVDVLITAESEDDGQASVILYTYADSQYRYVESTTESIELNQVTELEVTEFSRIYGVAEFKGTKFLSDVYEKSKVDSGVPIEIEILETGMLKGTVITRDGEAVPPTKITISQVVSRDMYEYRSVEIDEVTTSFDGAFLFDSLAPGEFYIRAIAVGYAQESASVSISSKEISDVQLTLVPLGELGGIVVDQSGNPIPDIEIRYQSTNTQESVITDENGLFYISNIVPNQNLHVRGEEKGFRDEHFNYTVGNLEMEILLKSEQETIVSGTVYDQVSREQIFDYTVTRDYPPEEILVVDGVFEDTVSFSPNNWVQYTIKAEGYPDQSVGFVSDEVIIPEKIEEVFYLSKGKTLAGYVMTSDTNQPAINTMVETLDTRGIPMNFFTEKAFDSTVTDAQGYFEINSRESTRPFIRLIPQDPYVPTIRRVDALEYHTDIAEPLLVDPGHNLKVVVTNSATGGALAGLNVEMENNAITRKVPSQVTDVSGIAAFSNLQIDTIFPYQITVLPAKQSTSVNLAADRFESIKFQIGTGEIKGAVMEGDQIVPSQVSASYEYLGNRFTLHNSAPAGSGRYDFKYVPGGTITLNYSKGGYNARQSDSYQFELFEGQSLEENIYLNTATITGVVKDSSGSPVVGAEINLSKVNAQTGQRTGSSQVASIVSGGRFRFDDVMFGQYEVSADLGSLGSVREIIDVNGDEEISLRLISGDSTLEIYVFDLRTALPVTNARVTVRSLDEQNYVQYFDRINAQGLITAENIPAGRHQVSVNAWQFKSKVEEVTLEQGETKQLEVVVYPIGIISWTVVNQNEEPLEGMQFRITPLDADSVEEVQTLTTSASGGIRSNQIMTGRYRIEILSAPDRVVHSEEITVETGLIYFGRSKI